MGWNLYVSAVEPMFIVYINPQLLPIVFNHVKDYVPLVYQIVLLSWERHNTVPQIFIIIRTILLDIAVVCYVTRFVCNDVTPTFLVRQYVKHILEAIGTHGSA